MIDPRRIQWNKTGYASQSGDWKTICVQLLELGNQYPLLSRSLTSTLFLVNGTVPFAIGSNFYNLQIRILLPRDFPRMPPKIKTISPVNQDIAIPSVLAQGWTASSTLAQLVAALCTAFSQNCPLPESDLVPYGPGTQTEDPGAATAFLQEVNDYLSTLQRESDQYRLGIRQWRLGYQAAEIACELCNQIQSENQCLEQGLATSSPEFVIPNDIEAAIGSQVQEEAYQKTVAILREDFREGRIALDDLLKFVRALSTQHFTDCVYPRAWDEGVPRV
jgi:hypothetical protein